MGQQPKEQKRPESVWTFLTNHAHVLLCIAEVPEARLRDVAERVGITERAVQRIVAELTAGKYLYKVRDGRRNRYVVREQRPLRHPLENHCTVAVLIDVALGRKGKGTKQTSKQPRGRTGSRIAKDRSSSPSA